MISSYSTKVVPFKSFKILQETSSSAGNGRHNLCKAVEYYRQHLSPRGVWLKKTILLNCQESSSLGTFQGAVSTQPMHFGSHYHTMLFYSSGLAMPPDKSKAPCLTLWIFKLFIASLLLLSQPHTTELRVQFIWQGYSLAAGMKTSYSSVFYTKSQCSLHIKKPQQTNKEFV